MTTEDEVRGSGVILRSRRGISVLRQYFRESMPAVGIVRGGALGNTGTSGILPLSVTVLDIIMHAQLQEKFSASPVVICLIESLVRLKSRPHTHRSSLSSSSNS